MVPGPATIEALVGDGLPGAVKLGPGVDLEALPAGEVEIIQRGGALVQAVLWCGALSRGSRRATRVDLGETFAAAPAPLPIAPAGPFLHEVAPAIERAGLLGALARANGLAAPHEHAGLLSGAEPLASAWLSPAPLLAELPGRIDEVTRWLARHGARAATVRVRRADDAAEWEAALCGGGPPTHAVHVTRDGARRIAWITKTQ